MIMCFAAFAGVIVLFCESRFFVKNITGKLTITSLFCKLDRVLVCNQARGQVFDDCVCDEASTAPFLLLALDRSYV
jgi:hypothetical protein